ncbi:MAG: lasso peptide biosynthesis B2 protein [Gammaproteobacteria bacterium]|nr:lasso peptide biosynthesis B2 protein [Gammaproteobacteria bacterium]
MKLKKLDGFFRLSGSEKVLLLEAVAVLAMTVGALRLLGFRRTLHFSGRHRRVPVPAGASAGVIASAETAVGRASRILHMGTCLSRSLALSRLLSARGVDTRLRIGVEKHPDGIAAHAWLEYAGQPASQGSGRSFDTVFTPPSASPASSG